MRHIKYDDIQIADLVMRLTGDVEPVGETNVDNKRLENLRLLEDVIGILIKEVCFCYLSKDRVEYSMKQIGKQAQSWIREEILLLNDLLENN